MIKAQNSFDELEEFFNYFHSTYIECSDIEFWNYYNEEYLRTNNPCQSCNNRLNSYFEKKPTFFQLINILSREESLIIKDYENLVIQGIRKIRTKPISDYYSCILYYK